MKKLFQSKIVWLSIVGFLLALIGGFTKTEIPVGLASEIVSLNWLNIGQALISLLVILVRWLFTTSRISGLL